MKKHLLSLIFTLLVVAPIALFAQSDNLVKGKRGGYMVSGDQQVFFEIVNVGNKVNFYPCDNNGELLKVAPTDVNITVVFVETTKQQTTNDVKLQNGAYTVSAEGDYPVYMYGINYTYNDQQNAVKFRVPGAPTPR